MAKVLSLSRDISPPPRRKSSNINAVRRFHDDPREVVTEDGRGIAETENDDGRPTLAAIEAGEAQIRDHLNYFATHFRTVLRSTSNPTISIDDFQTLYKRNQHKHGRHYVVHQHDHPISGVHYDLRLQFSESSTISFAIPYGLPGNPNSVRPNRMAIETRVHNLWNNLVESASHASGSLLIWDTGEYEILPWKENDARPTTDDELSGGNAKSSFEGLSQSERLFTSFQRRRIRLRLHGTRLPPDYTISMWLPSSNDRSDGQPKEPRRKRRRCKDPTAITAKREIIITSSDTESDRSQRKSASTPSNTTDNDEDVGIASDTNNHEENALIRLNNAYPGAANTIGSIHQRNWHLTLDKKNSGFRKAARSGPDEGRWVGKWEEFLVKGRDWERSVVSGRSADEVMGDAGVEKFVGRKMWRAILE